MLDHDQILIETIARHFAEASIGADGTIDLGIGGLKIACRINHVSEAKNYVSMCFDLWGGKLGETPVFASAAGYGEPIPAAIVKGGCTWACTFGPVLRVGLADERVEDQDHAPSVYELEIHGQRFRMVVAGYDLCIGSSEIDTDTRTQDARTRFGGDPWIAPAPATLAMLPILASNRPSIMSVFVSDVPGHRIIELKIDGRDWGPAGARLAEVTEPRLAGGAFLRELAVLTPMGKALLRRESLETTLGGLEEPPEEPAPRVLVDWPGWRAHGGRLGAPASADELAALEAEVGPLPDDYRHFLRSVAIEGAGPGYGLISPFAALQRGFVQGTFEWRDGASANPPPKGCLVLAHAGCGIVWLLVLSGDARGQVWLDGSSSDGVARLVEPSFEAWYRSWLDATLRGVDHWTQWDGRACSVPRVLPSAIAEQGLQGDAAIAELANQVKPGSIAIVSIGHRYFAHGDPLAPCASCVALAGRLRLGSEVFVEDATLGGAPASHAPKPGWLRRLASKLRGR